MTAVLLASYQRGQKNEKLTHRADFDEFLEEEGLRADVEATAIKRVIAYQIELEASKLVKNGNGAEDAYQPHSLDRLLDPTNASVTLQTLERAALALGKTLKIELA